MNTLFESHTSTTKTKPQTGLYWRVAPDKDELIAEIRLLQTMEKRRRGHQYEMMKLRRYMLERKLHRAYPEYMPTGTYVIEAQIEKVQAYWYEPDVLKDAVTINAIGSPAWGYDVHYADGRMRRLLTVDVDHHIQLIHHWLVYNKEWTGTNDGGNMVYTRKGQS